MKVFSKERYKQSLKDIGHENMINGDLIDNCKGRPYHMGVIIGKNGEEYRVALTWLEEVKHNDSKRTT